MISLFTGTPGSGKSLRVAGFIYDRVRRGRKTIANFNINFSNIKNAKKESFFYYNNQVLSPSLLVEYAKEHHVLGKENQTLLIIDEAQLIFNAREFSQKGRMDWISFFTQHRKLGFNIILITQYDKSIDKQMRALVEIEYKFRKLNNYKLGKLCPIPIFGEIEYHYTLNEKQGMTFFFYNKKHGSIYNTFEIF